MSTMPRATIADVARLAGVSSKTVSRVYADHPSVTPDTRDRVMLAARRLRFRPNNLARDLRRDGVANTVAFVIGDIQNPFYFSVAAGIERELASEGMRMVLASTDDSPDSEEAVVDALIAQRMRALLLIPIATDQSYLEGERQLGMPVVCVDRPGRNLTADSVVIRNRPGMAEAVRALLALGHRRIGFVGNPGDLYTVTERLAGYRDALREAGIIDTARWERVLPDRVDRLEAAVHSLLDAEEPPTALVTAHNRATTSAVHALRARPGEQIALIGFDDYDVADALGISVVSYDTVALGRSAARLALERLADPAGAVRQVEVPTRLVHRGSERTPVR